MAATNINRVVLTGNLTRDPELRSTPSGTSVCSLRIASNTRRKDNARASGSTSPTTSASPSGARRARTAPASCPRAARSASTGAWSGASGRARTATSASRSRSSPTPCSSSAAATTRPMGGGGNGNGFAPHSDVPARHRRTSRRRPWARATARRRTTTSRSRPRAAGRGGVRRACRSRARHPTALAARRRTSGGLARMRRRTGTRWSARAVDHRHAAGVRRTASCCAEAAGRPARRRRDRVRVGLRRRPAEGRRSGGSGVPGRSLMIRKRRTPSVIFRLWSSCSSSSFGPRNWMR